MKNISNVKKIYILLVILPFICTLLYYTFMASGMYISDTSFAVKSKEGSSVGQDFTSLLRTGGGVSMSDSYIIQNYISSLDMVKTLNEELNLKQHYSDNQYDFISRLYKEPTQNELLKYWQKNVKSSYDPDTGIITVNVRSFDAKFSKKLAEHILSQSEKRVNDMNKRSREDSLKQAKNEVEYSEKILADARSELVRFRNINAILDPKITATGIQEVIAKFEGEAALVKTEIADALSYMVPESHKVVSLKYKLTALEQQIEKEKKRLAGISENKVTLANIAADYEKLLIKEETAQKQHIASLASLEAARINADSKSRYVEPIRFAIEADEALYPERILYVIFAFIFFNILFLFLYFIISSIKEHLEA